MDKVQELKNEFDSLKEKLKDLNEDELDKISGGMAAIQERLRHLEEAGELTDEKKAEIYSLLAEEMKKVKDGDLSVLITSVLPKKND